MHRRYRQRQPIAVVVAAIGEMIVAALISQRHHLHPLCHRHYRYQRQCRLSIISDRPSARRCRNAADSVAVVCVVVVCIAVAVAALLCPHNSRLHHHV